MARSILRKLSACRSSLDANCSVDSLVTPSTTCATCSPNLLDGVRGVLDDVVEQAGRDGHDVEPHVGQQIGHFERMDQVGLAGSADLSLVLVGRKHIGLPEQFGVGLRVGGAHLFEEVFEPDHGCRCLTGKGTKTAGSRSPAVFIIPDTSAILARFGRPRPSPPCCVGRERRPMCELGTPPGERG
jgi:hypothetical protein